MIKPKRLQAGDRVQVIAPSFSLDLIEDSVIYKAEQVLKSLGLQVTYGRYTRDKGWNDAGTIEHRIIDLHEAFADEEIKGIICADGGYCANDLLKFVDWDLIQQHPKVFCGYSDITALNHAIYTKTGLITYSGPMICTFGDTVDNTMTIEMFRRAVFEDTAYELESSTRFIDDDEVDEAKRKINTNSGYWSINEGKTEGKILGMNLSTFRLLQGTEYFPNISGAVLCLEDDYEYQIHHFDRDLQSLIHLPQFNQVNGLVIGRFETLSNVSQDQIIEMVKEKKELANIPVVANVDFGHTNPKVTLPVGGKLQLEVLGKNSRLKVSLD